MQKKLLSLSFIEGAAVMAAELCGAKLMAPVYGSSLYVWASVMGITLAALAAGYFYGGLQSQKTDAMRRLFVVLSAASFFLLLMPLLSYYLLPRISYLSFLPAIVVSAVLLLLPPVFFLGASSPLFISVQSGAADSGRVSGTVYAVSTVGGILATFACGFWLIPEIGLSNCLLFFGSLLLCATLLVYRRLRLSGFLLFAGAIYLNLQLARATTVLYSSDSLLGHLEVTELQREKGKQRLLKVNNIIQTEMELGDGSSSSRYVHLLDTLIPAAATARKALVLGLGGGLTANLLVAKGYACTGVELDGRIIQMARDYFFLSPSVIAHEADARHFLNADTMRYDLVLVDVFRAEEQPSHVLTVESLERLKKNLSDSARLFINWHGYTQGQRGAGTSVLYNTLVRAGFKVQVFATGALEQSRNLIFLASLKPLPVSPHAMPFLSGNTAVNTDDHPVLESCNAWANMDWRVNYLRYYQAQPL